MITKTSKYIEENQIISIVGPTSSGKSALALELAHHYANLEQSAQIHLLSADSRQVYQGLTVLTGADIPPDWHQTQFAGLAYPSYHHPQKHIFLHGVNIITPTQEWSVAHLQKLFLHIQAHLRKIDRLIIVGGTGFYHLQIAFPASTLHIKPQDTLRQELTQESVPSLQQRLHMLKPDRLAAMNNSDRHNPRRLIRAIEVATETMTATPAIHSVATTNQQGWPIIHMPVDLTLLQEKITQRVVLRFATALAEVRLLLAHATPLSTHATTSTGFRQLAQFAAAEITKEACISLWIQAEVQYAKRQVTWWKKHKQLLKTPLSE